MAVLDREAVAWPLGHRPVRRILMLLHSLVPLQPISLHVSLCSHVCWKNRNYSRIIIALIFIFHLQLFCSSKGSVLRDVHCICVFDDYILYGCVEMCFCLCSCVQKQPGCHSFTSMQMCLHTWSRNANQPICMAFLLDICMRSLSSDRVTVSSTLRLI